MQRKLLTAGILALLLAGLAGAAAAQTVSLQGMFGPKALLVIDGGTPKALAPGEEYQGVKLLSARRDEAVVEIDGQQHQLKVGATPVSVDQPHRPGGQRIVLTADGNGHFFTQGSINSKPVQMLVDTGASVVTMSEMVARPLGLNYEKGRRVTTTTANGPAFGWLIKLDNLRVGDVTAHNVDTVVIPGELPMVLLGNSYLSRFNLRRDAGQLTLMRR